ncbi:MAG TPA: T9SS type A sorting domain-containing protein [Saprospiraceae bacterium]|nr:T9SS type A sorting domain-containing protein [Saprospiraceae bacterium]
MKTDFNGLPLDVKTLRSPLRTYETWYPDFYSLPDGGFAVSGYSYDTLSNAMLIRYDAFGDTLFTRSFTNLYAPPLDFIWPRAFKPCPDGGYVFACHIQGLPWNGYANADIWIVKTDSIGIMQWQKKLGNYWSERPFSLIIEDDGGILVGGERSNINLTVNNYTFQTSITKLDALGNIQWGYLSPVSEGLRYGAADMVLLEDGSLVVASGIGYEQQRSSVNAIYFEKYIFKLNPQREIEWEISFPEPELTGSSELTNILAVSDGSGYVVAGKHGTVYTTQNSFSLRGWLGKVSPSGDSLWTRQYVGIDQLNNRHTLYDIKETPDGGFILCGESRNPNPVTGEIAQQAWLLKLDAYGCLVPGCHLSTAAEEVQREQFELRLYPNPASEYLNFYLRAPAAAGREVSFRIFDASGALLQEFAGVASDATYIVPVWDWPAGTYLLQCVGQGRVLAVEKFVKR